MTNEIQTKTRRKNHFRVKTIPVPENVVAVFQRLLELHTQLKVTRITGLGSTTIRYIVTGHPLRPSTVARVQQKVEALTSGASKSLHFADQLLTLIETNGEKWRAPDGSFTPEESSDLLTLLAMAEKEIEKAEPFSKVRHLQLRARWVSTQIRAVEPAAAE